ncbi:MAG: hypothetical protein HUU21_36825 [Polyangiaceae bacterium]|nr:hypothetical protein [Polyangiaceae bacterium]NUQ79116.1 hypothetical protein [Polyangiaceae bacterium]
MEASEVERELEELETRIERLRALYEQYFMGLEKLEPLIPKKDVERRIWILRRVQVRNTGLRFKFQMLIQRFNTFQQYWLRVAREIENGTYRRDVLRAAKRFGAKEALTILGKKRAEKYTALAEAQEARRRPESAAEDTDEAEEILDDELLEDEDELLEADDLLEEDREESPPPNEAFNMDLGSDDEPPTLHFDRSKMPVLPHLPVPYPPPPTAVWTLEDPDESPPPPVAQKPIPAPRASDPEAAKRRVAELAAQMKARKVKAEPNDAPAAGPLELDFDFDSPRTARKPSKRASSAKLGAVKPPSSAAPSPAKGAATPRRTSTRSMRAIRPPSTTSTPRVIPPKDASDSSDDIETLVAPARRTERPPPAPRRTDRPPPRARHKEQESELEEKRLRQIYSKYIETKRSANEPTAGITYEKLADSLRAQAAKLRATHPAKRVDYEVVVKDGKTLLKPILR